MIPKSVYFFSIQEDRETKYDDDIFGSLFSIVLKRRVAHQKGLLRIIIIAADKYSLVVRQEANFFLISVFA